MLLVGIRRIELNRVRNHIYYLWESHGGNSSIIYVRVGGMVNN